MEIQAAQGPATGNPAAAQAQGQEISGDLLTELDSGSGNQASSDPSLTEPGSSQGTSRETTKPEPAGSVEATEQKLAGFTAAATKELRSDPRFVAWASKFKSFDDAAKSAMELEQKMGAMVSVPGTDATPEEKAAYLKKIGYETPDKATDYKLERIKDGYNDQATAEFAAIVHEAGLTQDQAAALYKKASEAQAEYNKNQREQAAAAKADADKTLKKEWGEDYQLNSQIMLRGYRAFVDKSFADRIKASGLGNDPSMLKLLFALGKTIQEDSSIRGEDGITNDGRPRFKY